MFIEYNEPAVGIKHGYIAVDAVQCYKIVSV